VTIGGSPRIIVQREVPIVMTGGFGGLGGLESQLFGMLGPMLGGFGGLFGGSASPFEFMNPDMMNQVIEEFLRNDPNRHGPPPASEDAISKLNEFKFDPCDSTRSCKTCSVCQDDYIKDDTVLEMPCKHEFHKDCVVSWLKLHNTCPVCRDSVESQNN